MRTVSVEAEIDLDDADFDDLFEAVKSRLRNKYQKKEELLEIAISICEELGEIPNLTLPVKTLDDTVKLERLQSVTICGLPSVWALMN